MTLHAAMRRRLLERAGIPPLAGMDLQEISRAQWSPAFEALMRRYWPHYAPENIAWPGGFIRLMKNRMVMGTFRYGLSDDPDKRHYACIGSARQRLALYADTGDTELLVDVANLMLLTFVEGNHPGAHVAPLGDTWYTGFPGSYYTMHGDKGELVDIACKAMAEFALPGHANAHFGSVGEDVPHAELRA